ncbi:BREX system Lon protease-like protein BrxL [Sinorhizobium medicae]|uniref:BREX system Lon protease-like protein BrxL n=1 Tax=Sinorhizobium medicae TaxID=110321 RepID=UPI00040B62CA|nr:BREX system Lon protease-like protein BrxL [Sinorhizobium medicae]MDX0695436.1 BREX system Lon protease-like protein BrxL [Sinorhizobium medicae]MDX0744958.1 BREX system Lon protease-like protein BrxL [Sinorhizobium medicae]
MSFSLDNLDEIGSRAFEGFVVRKDLVRRYSKAYPVPAYVVEFLLGRYCASTEQAEIAEGLEIVEKQLKDRCVRTGQEELFKAEAFRRGSVRLIDVVRARLDAKNACYVAELPSLALREVRIPDEMVAENERMLIDGFYAEVTLSYDSVIAQEKSGRPFGIEALRPIQMSRSDVLDLLYEGRRAFPTTSAWIDFLLRSIGLEPSAFDERAKRVALLRMVAFVERNYNLVELGPRGTGKSHLFQQISPYAHLISGGKATVARMFVNMASGQRGLVCQYDVVCFDEIAGVSFDSKDGVNIMKGYMASGEFSRGKDSIRAEGGIVLVGNLDVDLEQAQRFGHLLAPLPPEMRDDTAFMDRLHAYAPGWDYPKLDPRTHLTDHFGLVSDFLSECWTRLRVISRASVLDGRIHFGGALSGRDIEAVRKTVSGLVKLLHPDPSAQVPDEDLEWIVRLALESRRRVKEQQKRVFKSEFKNTLFSYTLGLDGVEQFVSTPELHSDEAIDPEPLPPGQVWAIGPGGSETGPGLYRIEVTAQPGSGVRILNQPTPPAFRESVKVAEQNLYAQARNLVGDRDPRAHEFTVQLRALDADKSGTLLGVPALVALSGAMLSKNTRGSTIVVGALALGGSVEPLSNIIRIAELAVEKQAGTLLLPVAARRQLNDLPDDLWTKISIEFYRDAADAAFKALEN